MMELDIPIADYAADNVGAPVPTLNSGLAHRILTRSPLHAWASHPKLNPAGVREVNEAMDFGSAVHSALLEGIDIVTVIDAPDWRTKAAKEARDDARALGRVPLLAPDAEKVALMVAVTNLTIASCPDLAGLGALDAERTIVWADRHTDVWLRCRPDWMTRDRSIILSYKTTSASAEPEAYAKTILNYGYDMQAAFELDGVKAMTGSAPIAYVWVVQETQPPFAVSLVGMSAPMRAYAMDRMGLAVDLWKRCLAADRWPGYPERVCYIEPPAWARALLDERIENES